MPRPRSVRPSEESDATRCRNPVFWIKFIELRAESVPFTIILGIALVSSTSCLWLTRGECTMYLRKNVLTKERTS
jgi:hypothetical protein